MAEYITKKTTKGKGENKKTVETTYRVDPDFVPSGINEICAEFIENYCAANNAIDWLLEKVNTKIEVERKQKDGTTKVVTMDYPFVSLRSDFANKYFPQIIKGDKKEELSLKDRLNKKYAK